MTKLTNNWYSDNYGYYTVSDDGVWSFLPLEKYYNNQDLLNISNILSMLNDPNSICDEEILKHDGWGEYVNPHRINKL